MSKPKLRVVFGTPKHGWLSVEVSTAQWSRSEVVSDVPSDSLAQLMSSLLLIAKGSPHEVVEWSLEPESWHWIFNAEGTSSLELSVTGEMGQVFVAHLPRTAALSQFCRSLLRLRSDTAWESEQSERTWSWPFPDESLSRLKSLVLGA